MLLARIALKNVVGYGHRLSFSYLVLGVVLLTVKVHLIMQPVGVNDSSSVTGQFVLNYSYSPVGLEHYRTIKSNKIDHILDHAERFMLQRGLHTFRQNFSHSDPSDGGGPHSSCNLVALLPAHRDQNVGTLVVYFPMGEESPTNAIAVSLMASLVQFIQNGTVWSKNLLFVLGREGSLGVEAFFEGYSATGGSPYISAAPIPLSYSDIHLALILDILPSHHAPLSFDFHGFNGILPRTDLINVATQLHSLLPADFAVHFRPSNWEEHSANLLRFFLRQLSASATSQPHSVFMTRGVPALTLRHPSDLLLSSLDHLGKSVENLLINSLSTPYKYFYPCSFYLMSSNFLYSPMYVYSKVFAMLVIPLCMECLLIFQNFACFKMQTPWSSYSPAKFEAQVRTALGQISALLGGGLAICLLSLHRDFLPRVFFDPPWKTLSDEVIILLACLLLPLLYRLCWGRISLHCERIVRMVLLAVYISLFSFLISVHASLCLYVCYCGTLLVPLFSRRRALKLLGSAMLLTTCPPVSAFLGGLLAYVLRGGTVELMLRGGLMDALRLVDLGGMFSLVYREYLLYGNYMFLYLSAIAWPAFFVKLALCLIGSE